MDSIVAAFDEIHNPYAKLGNNCTSLQRYLENNKIRCSALTMKPFTRENLHAFDILVIPCPAGVTFSAEEVDAIDRWVRQDGGGLLLLSHSGGDEEQETNLNEIGRQFGIGFEGDRIIDPKNNFGLATIPKIMNFQWHPVIEGMEEVCYRSGCSLNLTSPAIAVASSSSDAKPANVPAIVAAQCDEGRVVAAGTYEILLDQVAPNVNFSAHERLTLNIFNWLISDKRYQMRAQSAVPQKAIPVPESLDAPPVETPDGKKSRDILSELVKFRAIQTPEGNFAAKLILVGEPSVGKTSLALKIVEGRFVKDYLPTLGTNVLRKTLNLSSRTTLNWMIWDLGGQQFLQNLRKSFFSGTEGILFVCDITNPASLASVETHWIKELKDNNLDVHKTPALILVNKIDLVDKAKFSRRELNDFCLKLGLDYVETSALTGEHVTEAMEVLAYKFFELRKKAGI